MPNPKMSALNKNSSEEQVREAISSEIEVCMGKPGADQKQCAAIAYSMAREATGKALDYGR